MNAEEKAKAASEEFRQALTDFLDDWEWCGAITPHPRERQMIEDAINEALEDPDVMGAMKRMDDAVNAYRKTA